MKIVKLFSALILLQSLKCFAVMVSGPLAQETEITAGHIQKTILHYAAEEKDYVNGGITFTYPTGLFSQAPTVRITIESKIGYSASELITPCITANSSTQTTVRVNKGTLSVFQEAATNDVAVHLFAVGE